MPHSTSVDKVAPEVDVVGRVCSHCGPQDRQTALRAREMGEKTEQRVNQSTDGRAHENARQTRQAATGSPAKRGRTKQDDTNVQTRPVRPSSLSIQVGFSHEAEDGGFTVSRLPRDLGSVFVTTPGYPQSSGFGARGRFHVRKCGQAEVRARTGPSFPEPVTAKCSLSPEIHSSRLEILTRLHSVGGLIDHVASLLIW